MLHTGSESEQFQNSSERTWEAVTISSRIIAGIPEQKAYILDGSVNSKLTFIFCIAYLMRGGKIETERERHEVPTINLQWLRSCSSGASEFSKYHPVGSKGSWNDYDRSGLLSILWSINVYSHQFASRANRINWPKIPFPSSSWLHEIPSFLFSMIINLDHDVSRNS